MRIGVVCAAVLMIFGIILLAVNGEIGVDFYKKPLDMGAVAAGIAQLKAGSFMALGILFLIFTPILRVVASIFSFLQQKDWLYVVICSAVLVILAISFCIGFF